ncbi:hypothetical protein ACFQ4K_21680 [Tistrella bauzanensis]
MLRTMIGRSLATVATIVGLAVATAGLSRAEDIVLKMAHVYTPETSGTTPPSPTRRRWRNAPAAR